MKDIPVWILLGLMTPFCVQVIAAEATFVEDSKDASEFIGPAIWEHYHFSHCGGLMYTQRRLFYIDYKLETKLTAAEFCVWVFQPERESETVSLSYQKLPDPWYRWDGVSVYTWSKDGFREFELPRNTLELRLKARVIFVVHSTYPANTTRGNGFTIKMSGNLTFTGTKTHFVDTPEGEFSYPRGKTHYDNNDYFALVIQTQKNRNPSDVLKFKHIELTDVDTEEGRDVIEVYELYPYGYLNAVNYYPGTSFKQIASLSGRHDGPVQATASFTPFPYIVLFTSDKKVTGTGFTVCWSNPDWLE